jgi:hypothetical protein
LPSRRYFERAKTAYFNDLDLGRFHLAKRSWGKVAERESAELNSVQRQNGQTHRGKHTAHLMVLALSQHQLGDSGLGGNET